MAERTLLMEIPASDVLHMHIVRSRAARDVLAERERQIKAEGWTPEHDDEHDTGELAFAASCYAHQAAARAWMFGALDDAAERYKNDEPPDNWPDSWDTSWWRPKNPRRDLVRAAALLLAEIERLDRAGPPGVKVPAPSGHIMSPPSEEDADLLGGGEHLNPEKFVSKADIERTPGVPASGPHPLPAQANDGGEHG